MISSTLPEVVLPHADDDYDRRLLADVTTIGWHHVHVQSDGKEPAFAFSLGFFANYGRPEIIVFGLPAKTANEFLNIVAIKVAGGQEELVPFKAYENIAEDSRIAFIPVARRYYPAYLGYAGWFYQSIRADFPLLQMVWPDRSGVLPWESGYDLGLASAQPLLYEPASPAELASQDLSKADVPEDPALPSDRLWPFDSPPNVPCITVKAVMRGTSPILMAFRDSEDGGWQFLTGDPITMADAMLVSLQEIVDLDSTILQLAALPPGGSGARDRRDSSWMLEIK